MTAMTVVPGFTFDAQPIFLQPLRDETEGMMKDMQSQLLKLKSSYEAPVKTTKNPCATDLARTGCKDAVCLKRHAESLTGSCAELLLKPTLEKTVPEPSPAPVRHSSTNNAADLIQALLGQNEAPKPLRRTMEPMGMSPMGHFQFVSTDEEGHTKTTSGPITSRQMPPELAMMAEMMPDIAEMLSAFTGRDAPPAARPPMYPTASIGDAPAPRTRYPIASIGDDPEEVAAAKRVAHHPCGDEIMKCRQVTGHSMGEIKRCLMEHLEQLSPKCKCFINQVEGPEKMQKQLPPTQKAAAAPAVHALTPPKATTRVVVIDDDVPHLPEGQGPHGIPPPPHGRHGGPCLFMMTATFILFVLALRKCLRCFCGPPPPPTMAVVVPPEQTSIKLVEPLRADEIKMVAIAK